MTTITFNTAQNKITVGMVDGTSKDYFTRSAYLADWPERAADCDAMGWQ